MGIYVELPNTIEGMVRVSDMSDDYYIMMKSVTRWLENTPKTYKLGQTVTVEVIAADKLLHTIDFALWRMRNNGKY